MAAPSTASAHYQHSFFSFKDPSSGSTYVNSACYGKAVDPITFLQFGSGMTNVIYAQQHVRHHTDLSGTQGGGQANQNHGYCWDQRGSDGQGFHKSQQTHTRYFQNGQSYHVTDAGNYVWYHTPHRERRVGCGHAVYRSYYDRSGFDWAAGFLVSRFLDDHGTNHRRSRVTYDKHAARRTFEQCEGTIVAWDGRVHHVESP